MHHILDGIKRSFYRGLAITYQTVGMKQRALSFVNVIIEKGYQDAFDWWIQGSIYAELEKWEEAYKALGKAYECGYIKPKCIYWLGKAVENKGEYDLACQYYDDVLENDKRNLEALNAKGQMYFKKKEYIKALSSFEKCLEIRADDWEFMNNVGLCYLNLQKLSLAKQYLKKAVRLKKNDGLLRYNLAIVLTRMEEYKEAIEVIDKYYDDQSLDILILMGYCYAQLKMYKQSINFFEKSLSISSDNNEVLMNLSAVYAKNKEKDKALKIIKTLLKQNNKNYDILNNLAWVYEELGMYQEAEANYYRSFVLSKEDPCIAHNLICCFMKQNKYDEAMLLLTYLKSSSSWNNTAWNIEAKIYELMDAKKKAVFCYNKALGLE